MKKYSLSSTVDKTEIFNYPFITDSRTISYIEENGHVMFLIRGLPYTGKTTISGMLRKTYPNAVYCSAVKFLSTVNPMEENILPKDLKDTVELCQKKVKEACLKKEKIIIVQNSHIKKFEIQPYLNFATKYYYTVIMIETNNRYEITPEAIENIAKTNPNGLEVNYLMTKFKGWEVILPKFTGWFISFDDSLYIHYFTLRSLEPLLEAKNFCKNFSVCTAEDLRKCFHLRKVLSCIAGYFEDPIAMKGYDLLDKVQESYGRIFTINIVGYLVSSSGIIAIVQVDEEAKCLIHNIEEHIGGKNTDNNKERIHKKCVKQLNPLYLERKREIVVKTDKNVRNHGDTFELRESDCPPLNTTVTLKEWSNGENIDTTKSSFIHLGQRNFDLFDISKIRREFKDSLKLISDNRGIIPDYYFDPVNNGTKICRLTVNVWLVKIPQIMCVKTVFTGFYA